MITKENATKKLIFTVPSGQGRCEVLDDYGHIFSAFYVPVTDKWRVFNGLNEQSASEFDFEDITSWRYASNSEDTGIDTNPFICVKEEEE